MMKNYTFSPRCVHLFLLLSSNFLSFVHTCMIMRLRENICESENKKHNDELNLHEANTTHF